VADGIVMCANYSMPRPLTYIATSTGDTYDSSVCVKSENALVVLLVGEHDSTNSTLLTFELCCFETYIICAAVVQSGLPSVMALCIPSKLFPGSERAGAVLWIATRPWTPDPRHLRLVASVRLQAGLSSSASVCLPLNQGLRHNDTTACAS